MSEPHSVSAPTSDLIRHATDMACYILAEETESLRDCIDQRWTDEELRRHITYRAVATLWHLGVYPEKNYINPERAFQAYVKSLTPQSAPHHPEDS